ncbi:MAG TPA: crossover junction endodeoxyribonuclease RuvC, partial [Candidatus Limnocylindrales bacterium]|nr:crossover junction endodeoxyribonuclease RuvC [Candidatus Limnocylindrales bacterium]
IVLGIDPGTAATGYGVIERSNGTLRAVDHGCLDTPPSLAMPQRLRAIHAFVADLIETHDPTVLAVERLYFSRNAQTALAVGQARGVVLLAAAQREVPVIEATPNEVKRAVAGYGAAEKGQVARMVQIVAGMADVPEPDDAADALAIAIWGANVERTAAAVARVDGQPRSGVTDRAAVAPIATGETAYERAVREALEVERGASRAKQRRAG